MDFYFNKNVENKNSAYYNSYTGNPLTKRNLDRSSRSEQKRTVLDLKNQTELHSIEN